MNCRRRKLRLEERKRRNRMVLLSLKREGLGLFILYVCYSNHECKVSNRTQELGCVAILASDKVFAGRGLDKVFFCAILY
ncbi:hypothetical protein CEE34_10060 [Candidatus Aerophobetes bacterium Ae_b3a]|nr:MAG: hypothetical protein CEE34_10060 [Candidatus Aerophobetes bacterium Ae_b3a]